MTFDFDFTMLLDGTGGTVPRPTKAEKVARPTKATKAPKPAKKSKPSKSSKSSKDSKKSKKSKKKKDDDYEVPLQGCIANTNENQCNGASNGYGGACEWKSGYPSEEYADNVDEVMSVSGLDVEYLSGMDSNMMMIVFAVLAVALLAYGYKTYHQSKGKYQEIRSSGNYMAV